jgi:UDP-N-acetylglucosamine 2-epimerase (non-hydrolysing)
MISVIYGTTGELIKLAPVLVRLQQRGLAFTTVTTGQQVTQIPPLLELLELPQPDLWLARGAKGRDLRSNGDIPGWLARVVRTFAREGGALRRHLRGAPTRPLVVVHGDTMTTVLGSLMGRALRMPVAHIEGGLRSFDLLHPFPEELNRRVASRLARVHYAPGPWAAANLSRGEVVDTGTNTIRDSLELCPLDHPTSIQLPNERFGLVSLHRFELLNDRRLLGSTLRALAEHARQTPLLFIDHPVTVAAVEKAGLGGLFDDRLIRTPRLSFFEFLAVLRRSAFLITDSGGSQEECFYLDHPCLVHRKRTERREGLGENVVLSGLSEDALRSFLADPQRYRRTSPLPTASASEIIVDDLVRRGHV